MSVPDKEKAIPEPRILLTDDLGVARWEPDYEYIRVSSRCEDGRRILTVKLFGSRKTDFILSVDQARHLASLLTSDSPRS